jgi:hypothetical protein
LFVDDAHSELGDVNDLLDFLASDSNHSLKLILVSSTSQWYPRVKTPSLHKAAVDYFLNRIQGDEIDLLLNLAESVTPVRNLVEEHFPDSRGASGEDA